MTSLFDDGALQEVPCGGNIAYILSKDISILPTEFKVMQNQDDGCMIRCMQMKYNGLSELYYLTAGYQSFLTVFMAADGASAAILIASLINSILELKNIGFLSCCKIDNRMERYYVDSTTNHVKLLYLPTDKAYYQDEISFENELRSALVKRIDLHPKGSIPMSAIRQRLMDGTLLLERVVVSGTSRSWPDEKKKDNVARDYNAGDDGTVPLNRLVLTALNSPEKLQFTVSGQQFLLGRKVDQVDGAITFNKAIGRTHCKIVRQGTGFAAIDLNSANGTFLNGSRLAPQQPYGIKTGDMLRLANLDFRVTIQ